MLMKVAHLLGMKENNAINDHDELLLRILTPLLKLYTGKQVKHFINFYDKLILLEIYSNPFLPNNFSTLSKLYS